MKHEKLMREIELARQERKGLVKRLRKRMKEDKAVLDHLKKT